MSFADYINLLAQYGVSVVELSMASDNPTCEPRNIPNGIIATITIRVPNKYDAEEIIRSGMHSIANRIQILEQHGE